MIAVVVAVVVVVAAVAIAMTTVMEAAMALARAWQAAIGARMRLNPRVDGGGWVVGCVAGDSLERRVEEGG